MKKYFVEFTSDKVIGGTSTILENETITVSQCKEIVKTLLGQGHSIIERLKIDLTQYTDYDENEEKVCDTEEYHNELVGDEKTAIYYPDVNVLKIYEYGTLVYGNLNGTIIYSEEQQK